jgi:RimJ/RimL family protein N-acetyltransferase
MRFISKGQPTKLEQIEQEILPRVIGYYSHSPPRGVWAAHLVASDEFIGWFHLRPDKFAPEEMELGYRLKRSAWGAGLATEGSRALVAKGINEYGYEKISGRALAGNLASRRVLEKTGLKFECEFFWPEEMLPEWTEEERRGVKYGLNRKGVASCLYKP